MLRGFVGITLIAASLCLAWATPATRSQRESGSSVPCADIIHYTKFPYHGRNMNTKSTIVGLGRQYGGVSMTRRRFLGLACTVSASAALVACGGAGSSTSALASAVSGKPAASAAFASKSTSRLKLTVVYTAPVAQNMPVWMAEATHGFADRNLTVEMQSMEGSLATKAMVAKEMDVLLQGAIGMIGASLNGGVDLVYVASEINHSGATLNVAPGIHDVVSATGATFGRRIGLPR